MPKPLCLVTGGAGFIGSHVVDKLLSEGYRVRVFDNLSTGNKSNLKHRWSQIEYVKGDLRNQNQVRGAARGVDYIFHLAANRAVLRSVDNPLETDVVNIRGTLHVLLAARDEKVKRVIFSSSSSVYGEAKKFPVHESDSPNPQSPYAASKYMGEIYCRLFSHLYGLETVSLRYFNVFGPRQNPESKYSMVIPIFIECILKGKQPEVHWDGKQSRDFTYIDNVVQANFLAMKKPGLKGGEVFNVACHEEFSVLDILKHLEKIIGKQSKKPIFAPKRQGDVRRTFADITKIERRLGYRVKTYFKEGLEKTANWFLEASQVQEGNAQGKIKATPLIKYH